MPNMFKILFILVISIFLFASCSSKEEIIIDYKTQQKNSKEALNEL